MQLYMVNELQYSADMLELTRRKAEYEHNKEVQRMLQEESEQLKRCSLETEQRAAMEAKKKELEREKIQVRLLGMFLQFDLHKLSI
jgi:hypothetical protein